MPLCFQWSRQQIEMINKDALCFPALPFYNTLQRGGISCFDPLSPTPLLAGRGTFATLSRWEGVAKAPLPVSGSHAAPGNEKTQPD